MTALQNNSTAVPLRPSQFVIWVPELRNAGDLARNETRLRRKRYRNTDDLPFEQFVPNKAVTFIALVQRRGLDKCHTLIRPSGNVMRALAMGATTKNSTRYLVTRPDAKSKEFTMLPLGNPVLFDLPLTLCRPAAHAVAWVIPALLYGGYTYPVLRDLDQRDMGYADFAVCCVGIAGSIVLTVVEAERATHNYPGAFFVVGYAMAYALLVAACAACFEDGSTDVTGVVAIVISAVFVVAMQMARKLVLTDQEKKWLAAFGNDITALAYDSVSPFLEGPYFAWHARRAQVHAGTLVKMTPTT